MFYRLPEFNYYRPTTLKEALHLLSELEDAKVLAGGTDLLIDLRIRRYRPKNIIDISRLKELKYIIDEGDKVRIGSLTTLQELIESPIIRSKAPLLAEAAYNMSSWQIRNIATIGGNLCNASPAADTAPPLMIYEAKLKLISIDGERAVPITKFFKGPRKTELRSNEILAEIEIPYVKDVGSSFIKLGRRDAFTLSIVAVATAVSVKNGKFSDVRISLNAVAPTPIRAYTAENYLKGKDVTIDEIKKAAELVLKDISPISDVRASAEYRKEMSVLLTIDSIVKSLDRLGIKVEGWEL